MVEPLDNWALDEDIKAQADTVAFGPALAAEGITTVALDPDGNLVEHSPDGSEEFIA